MNKPIRILFWADSPAIPTGFGTVTLGILSELSKDPRFDIDVIGINDRGGWKDPDIYPYRIYPAMIPTEVQGDFFGRPRVVSALLNKDTDIVGPWDLVFTLNDPFILEQRMPVLNRGLANTIASIREMFREKSPPEYLFKMISYIPIDSPIKGNWLQDSINHADYAVAYSEYGKEEIIKANKKLDKPLDIENKLSVIYHGVNQKHFFPVEEKEKKEFRKLFFQGVVKEDTFLIIAVARNQMRKDLPRTLKIFREFQKRRPDSFLYLHCQESDAWGSIHQYAQQLGLVNGKDYGVPKDFHAATGFPVSAINMLYNTADVVLSTSNGEGVGFHNLESMATNTLIVGPDNSVYPELYGYDKSFDVSSIEEIEASETLRGVPVLSGSTPTEYVTYGPQDLERYRPIVNVQDAVKKLTWIYDNPEKAKKIADRGYEWIKTYTWEYITKQWIELFEKAYADLENDRASILRRIANNQNGKQTVTKGSKGKS